MKKKDLLILGTGCFVLTLVFMIPYFSNELSLEHDTLFHLSRIEGLAQSFQSGKLFPDLYPLKNDGFGYASALFYCDFFLVPAALLYMAGCGVALCYKATVFMATLVSAISMSLLLKKIRSSNFCALIASALYLFSNYRISDVYVRGALGEVIALAFVPFVLLGAYQLLIEKQPKITYLVLGFSAIALSHNLTLLLCVLGFGALLIVHLKHMNKERWIKLIQATLLTIALCAWYLFPMLEHTSFQEYYLHYYASSSDLAYHALNSWQYLINETIFGLSGNAFPYEQAMVLTPGIALIFLPFLNLFDTDKDKNHRFIRLCTYAGYLCMFLCSSLVPWQHLSALRILQFPWRLMTLAVPLLALSSAYGIAQVFRQQKTVQCVLLALILINGIHLIEPAKHRTSALKNDSTYAELLDGSIVDPYYANTSYHRIEVAGADYLPIGFLDYKNASRCITDLSDNEVGCSIIKGAETTFSAPQHTDIILPLTAYKGYHIYADDEEIPWNTVSGRISINTKEHTEFTVLYKKTMIHNLSILISLCALIYLIKKGLSHN